jgi:uncharacterized protein
MQVRCIALAAAMLLAGVLQPTASRAGAYEDGDSAFRGKNYDVALKHWHPVAEAGDARAQLGLATLYYGGHGMPMDYAAALGWCQKAADQGNPQAQYMLASMYRDGKGATADRARAAVYFRSAAEQNIRGAQYSLGLMYHLGEGIPVDYGEAYYWLSLASDGAGEESAQLRMVASHVRDEVKAKLNAERLAELNDRVTAKKSAAASR